MNVFVKLRFVTKLLCLVGFSLIVLIGIGKYVSTPLTASSIKVICKINYKLI